MANSFYRSVTKILSEHGFEKLSGGGGKGSHEKWQHPERPEYILTVTYNMKSRHTANHLLKRAGIDKKI